MNKSELENMIRPDLEELETYRKKLKSKTDREKHLKKDILNLQLGFKDKFFGCISPSDNWKKSRRLKHKLLEHSKYTEEYKGIISELDLKLNSEIKEYILSNSKKFEYFVEEEKILADFIKETISLMDLLADIHGEIVGTKTFEINDFSKTSKGISKISYLQNNSVEENLKKLNEEIENYKKYSLKQNEKLQNISLAELNLVDTLFNLFSGGGVDFASVLAFGNFTDLEDEVLLFEESLNEVLIILNKKDSYLKREISSEIKRNREEILAGL